MFATNLFYGLALREFEPVENVNSSNSVSITSYWTVRKVQDSALLYINLISSGDAARLAMRERETLRRHSAVLLGVGQDGNQIKTRKIYFKNVINIYVLLSEDEAGKKNDFGEFASCAAAYESQPYYEIYWKAEAADRKILSGEGQPTDLFGLRRAMEAAFNTENNFGRDVTFGELIELTKAKPANSNVTSVPFVTYIILFVNALVVFYMYLDGFSDDPTVAVRFGAIVPELIFYGGQYYRLFTATFVHFGVVHLAANATGLIIFGTRVERSFGRIKFSLIYIFSGLCGSLFSLFFTRSFAAGASGAVYGLTGAVFAFSVVTKRSMERLTGYTMLIFSLIGLAMGAMTPGIDNFGHIGGFLAGALAGAVLTKRV